MNKVFRKLNLKIAPVLVLPLLITSVTGIILGLGDRLGILPSMVVDALIIIHQGAFLGRKLVPFYVLLLGLGVFVIGLTIFIRIRDNLKARNAGVIAINLCKIIGLVIVFPLAVCIQTGVGYRIGTDWLDLSSSQTAIFWSLHTGIALSTVPGVLYTLITGFGLMALAIMGVEITPIGKTSLPEKKLYSPPTIVEPKSESTPPLLDNVLRLRNKIHNAIIIFSFIFLVIISLAISAVFPSVIIVAVFFTIPAAIATERLTKNWQLQQEIQVKPQDREAESATILRAIPDSILRMSEDGICLSYIPAKEANPFTITGEIINRHVNEFLDPKIALRFIKSAQLSLKSGLTHYYRFPIPAENGGRRYYEARITAIGMTEVLIMVRQLSDLDQTNLNSTQLSDAQNEDTILLLSEPELAEILERTLDKIQKNNQNHILCCLVIEELNIENDSEVDPELQSGSRVSGILMYQIAAKVKTHLSSNYIARLGDNELVTLILNSSLDRASTLVDKLRNDLNSFSFQWKEHEYPVSTSIGLLEINAESLNTTTDLINAAKATCDIARQKVEVKTFW